MIKVIGLDLSLRAPGVCVSDMDPVVMSPPPTMRGGERLSHISRAIEALVIVHGVSMAAMETPAFGLAKLGHTKTIIQLAELNGAVKACLADQQVSVLDVSPSQLKKFATGSGASTVKKSQVKAACIKLWNCPARGWDDNQYDAFVLARIAEAYMTVKLDPKSLKMFEDHQRPIIKDLDKKELS